MSTDIPVECNLAPAPEIPLLSRLAWERLLSTWPEASRASSDNSLESWAALRLASLPGWEQVAVCVNDDWVFRYEQLQEGLAKEQRKKGRPQNGVFYTPPSIARYLTVQTLGHFLTQTRNQMYDLMRQSSSAQSKALAQTLWVEAQQAQVIDPACGTGVFLVEALKLFSAFYQEVAQAIPEFSLSQPAHFALRHQLAGVDLDPLSVMITELRLAQWAARLDDGASWLDSSVLSFDVGDTLGRTFWCHIPQGEQPRDVAGSQARSPKWQFILGNPPYVSEVRGQAQLFKKLQDRESPYYQAKMDLCDGFLAWAIDHLPPGGKMAYVLPAYWTQRSSTASLRARLWTEGQLLEMWAFEGGPLFKNAPGHHSALLIWQKNANIQPIDDPMALEVHVPRAVTFGQGRREADLCPENLKTGWATLETKTGKLLWGEMVELALLAKLAELPPLLLSNEIQQGLVMPQSRLKPVGLARLPQSVQAELAAEPGVFVLDAAEVQALDLTEAEHLLLRPYYRPKGFGAFQGFPQWHPPEQIIYTDLKNRWVLESNPVGYARLREHLDRFSAVNTSAFAPYGLHRPRQSVWFEDACKVLAPRQVLTPAFAAVPFPAYVNEGFLILRSSEDAQWLCALLNSQVAWFWFYHQKRKGVRLQIDKEVLRHFPKPLAVSQKLRRQCVLLATQLALPNIEPPIRKGWMTELNALVAQAYRLTPVEMAWLVQAQSDILHHAPMT